MNIKQITSVNSGYKSTIPIFIDCFEKNVKILHGNLNCIKLSELKDNELKEIDSIQNIKLRDYKGLLFKDLNNDGNNELLYVNEEDIIKEDILKEDILEIYTFKRNKFVHNRSYNLSFDLNSKLKQKDIKIRFIKKVNHNIILGTNHGLIIYDIDGELNLKYVNHIKEHNIWECVLSNFSEDSDNFLFISSEEKLFILNMEFQKIFEIDTNQRVYQIDLFDFDNCGTNEIICCTQKGVIIIYKVHFKDKAIFNSTEFFSRKVIFEKECGRAKNPAINSFLLYDLNKNGRINIIIGGHDYKVKFYEWNTSKHDMEMIFSCDIPREQVYSIKILNDKYNNLCLLYSTFVEEISYNHIIIYHTVQSKFTKRIIKSIAERLIKEPEKFCFFLGAGFSYYENNLLKSTPLAKHLIQELFSKYDISEEMIPFPKYKDSLEYVLLFLKKIYPNENIKGFIKNRFKKDFITPKSIKIFSKLVKQGIIKQIFTVNWDLLLENHVRDELKTYYKFSDFNLCDLKKPFYFKLHGTSSDIDSIVASIDEIEINEDNYSLHLKRNILKLFYDSNNFIFIGYSFHDLDFIDIFENKLYTENINIYIFDPNPNKMMYNIIDNRIKMFQEEKFHFHIFKCKADDFFKVLNNNISKLQKKDYNN